MIEYTPGVEPRKIKSDRDVHQYAKFSNKNFKLCEDIDEQIIKHGHMNYDCNNLVQRIENELEGTQALMMFQLGKHKNLYKE